MATFAPPRVLWDETTPQESADTYEYQPGSAADFDRLYKHSYWKIVGTLTGLLGGDRATAEDCAQDAFARAFRAWPRWRPDAPARLIHH